MSGGSHNPNGRQSQLGPGWSPLQLQMASYLARAPQAHMAERGVSWHTPTPPPHLYHMPTSSSPDPLQAMKAVSGSGNSVFRHTATPPDIFRHTPTPPDKHLIRHTPSPGDPKAGASVSPADLFPHIGPVRDKLGRPEDLLYPRAGVDLSLGRSTSSNGAPLSLSVRDAPTINSLIARAAPRRVDTLLERLSASPSVIVHPKPPTSSDDEESAPKRKRKQEKTLRLNLHNGKDDSARRKTNSESSETIDEIAAMIAADDNNHHAEKMDLDPLSQEPAVTVDKLKSVLASPENDTSTADVPLALSITASDGKPQDLPEKQEDVNQNPPETLKRAEEIDKPAAESPNAVKTTTNPSETNENPTVPPKQEETIPDETTAKENTKKSPKKIKDTVPEAVAAAAPKRRSTRLSNTDCTNVPIESPSEGKPAETTEVKNPQPTTAFVEVETELAKMFAGIEEPPKQDNAVNTDEAAKKNEPNKNSKKRRKSVATKGERKARRPSRSMTEESVKKKPGRKKQVIVNQKKKGAKAKEGCDAASNASSSRSRGPYIQIRGPRESPVSVCVKNVKITATGEEEVEPKRGSEFRNGHRVRGLHASTLGLRYDAATRDLTWLCIFCGKPPHAEKLGDLFGPYKAGETEVWLHEDCAVWAPGLVAAGARLWGLEEAVEMTRETLCSICSGKGAGIACATRQCKQRAHLPCARKSNWTLESEVFKALCSAHRQQ